MSISQRWLCIIIKHRGEITLYKRPDAEPWAQLVTDLLENIQMTNLAIAVHSTMWIPKQSSLRSFEVKNKHSTNYFTKGILNNVQQDEEKTLSPEVHRRARKNVAPRFQWFGVIPSSNLESVLTAVINRYFTT